MATLTMKQFEKKIKYWAKHEPSILEKALKTAAEIVRGEAVQKHLSGPKMAKGKGSLKNATLARHSGDLAGSINTKVSVTKRRQSAQVGTSIKYAHRHEAGTFGMPKRPFLSPSLEAKRQKILDIILDQLIEGYKRS